LAAAELACSGDLQYTIFLAICQENEKNRKQQKTKTKKKKKIGTSKRTMLNLYY
jgi:hypothetical protein